jgi:predicted nucleotidyltransferase
VGLKKAIANGRAILLAMTGTPSLDALRRQLSGAPADVVAAYVFGSVGRGTSSSSSDVDIAILLRTSPPSTLEGRMLDYEAALERDLGRAVQLIVLNDAPPDLAYRVLRDGRIVLERDRVARLRFEVRTRNVYFDLLPILARYRRRALERAAAAQ